MFKEMNIKEYQKLIIDSDIASRLNLKNSREVPKIVDIYININYSLSIIRAIYVLQLLFNRKPKLVRASQSIAGFNLREGTITSYKLSLHSNELYAFLDTLSNTVVPRLRNNNNKFEIRVNNNGDVNIGIENIKIFPMIEHEYDKIASNIGMNINIITSSSNTSYIKSMLNYLHLII